MATAKLTRKQRNNRRRNVRKKREEDPRARPERRPRLLQEQEPQEFADKIRLIRNLTTIIHDTAGQLRAPAGWHDRRAFRRLAFAINDRGTLLQELRDADATAWRALCQDLDLTGLV